jgi:hypothetical protein
MEDLAGEREIKMGEPRTLNLNTRALMKGKQHRRYHEDFHFRSDGIKIVGKEDSVQECKECHILLPLTAFTTHTLRGDGAYYLLNKCRECGTILQSERWAIRKNAPPKPDNCDICHENKKLELDHLHGTTKARGWVCRNCNTGIGALGDTLDKVLRAAIYLEKDKSKIIEVLNEIKNEKT